MAVEPQSRVKSVFDFSSVGTIEINAGDTFESNSLNMNKFDTQKSKEVLNACRKGDEHKVLQLYYEGKADVNFQDENGLTPLHHAFIKKRSAVIIKLIEFCKIDLNLPDKKG